ncbi:response regulator receiver and SARP domain protein [Aneurinibacillus soli]|uniref:Transcriptional regulatory protein YehT n=1 Tax=Aneurinibacillus soli TaxID=1500254 RepID=A0A0U5B810_9BACL|nr:response regulator [Aneurinibacillus soli]PYE61255.1 response regulator receiver and SARP domain protein [Aneurinibacillus soli]BAU26311.1 Transcriptional regulatory protein YehT [Aneurinibacillus soli]
MFQVVIVEDEKPILDLMRYVLERNPNYTITGAFTNPVEALQRLPELRPDVVFLDVEMPKMNGLELAQRINVMSENIQIIFTTAYKQYALDAFDVCALDYILKPVMPAAIERVTNRLLKQHRLSTPGEQRVQPITIRCFGGFEVRNSQGALVRWSTRKTEELFAFFLCHPGRDISKWRLIDLLWPDMEEERATHNVHNTIYRLKKLLKEHKIGMDILKTSDGYLLETSNHQYDVLQFQQHDLTSVDELVEEERAEHLCSLYTGLLLEGKDYAWKTQWEEVYGNQYTSLVQKLHQKDLARQDWKRAERRLEAFLSVYPLHEEMNLALLRIYTVSGEQEKLAKHYARFESLYRREIGLELPQEVQILAASHLSR